MRFTFALAFEPENIPETQAFWGLIVSGPKVLRPKTAGVTEPLRKIEKFNPKELEKEIIWKNGKKCFGYFQPKGFKGKATLSINLEYQAEKHTAIIEGVHGWLQENFEYRLLYGISPNEALAAHNLELQQTVSCGAIPPDESIIIENSGLFEVFEINA